MIADAGSQDEGRTVRAPYHHGDLHRALINAGLALMEEQGSWDFSLRELARRAGVSHNAPYKHFADKQALLFALAQAGFEALRITLEEAAAKKVAPDEALLAIGVAYVAFGRLRPAHYRLMFGALLPGSGALAQTNVSTVALASKEVLRRVIFGGVEAGIWNFASDDAAALERAVLAAWALVHGVTLLFLDGFIPAADNDLADRIASDVIRLQLRGFYRLAGGHVVPRGREPDNP